MHIKDRSIELNLNTQHQYHQKNESQSHESSKELLQTYEKVMSEFSYAKVDLSNYSLQAFQEHKITLLSNIYQPFGKHKDIQKTNDFIFSIVQSQFYGLQYIYEIIISQFKLKINILNLQRQSDTGEDDVDSKELGTGSFGVVRVLKINDKEYAVKRIPFHYKLEPEQGYDYEVNKGEYLQLRQALKQYCYYKIFSVLGIGPKIVKTNYDLICFNNCIQFKMELCEPLVNKLSDTQQQFDFTLCKNQLYQRLAKLHSMNFVHRDIKPQNILYNAVENCFIFGDFGLVSYIKEKKSQKTQTRFAGTPNYCGDQMSKLLNGGLGLVNLYLNDLFCLQKTFTAMGDYFVSHNSRISENSLSYNAYGSYFNSDANSFQQGGGQVVSQSNFTDESYFPTRNSAITIPTAHTLGPKRYASSINHYQSEIIFEICRSKQRTTSISRDYLINLIECKYKQHQNTEISTTLLIQLLRTFHLEEQEQNSQVINLIKEWKNSSRHFGPQDIRTINHLKSLEKITDQDIRQKLSKIVKSLNQCQSSSKQHLNQLNLMKALKNNSNYICCFYSYLKSLIHQCEHKKSSISEDDCIIIAQEFIKVARIEVYETGLALLINKLVRKAFKLWHKKQHPLYQSLRFVLDYLRSKGKERPIDSVFYLQFVDKYPYWTNEKCDSVQKEIQEQVNRLVNLEQDCLNQQAKFNFIWLLLQLSKGHNIKRNEEIKDCAYFKKASQMIEREQVNSDPKQPKEGFIFIVKLAKVIALFQNDDYEAALEQCYTVLKWSQCQSSSQKYTKVYLQINDYISTCLIKLKKYNQALIYLQKNLSILEQYLGCLNDPQRTFAILNNMAFVYGSLDQPQKEQQLLCECLDFLQKSNHKHKQRKLTYVLRLQMQKLCRTGLVDEQKKQKASILCQKILRCFYLYFTNNGANLDLLTNQANYHLITPQCCTVYDKYFIFQTLSQNIRSKPQYYAMFYNEYCFSNFQLAIYYHSQPQKNLNCMKYIWKSLKTRLQRQHPSQLIKMDYLSVIIYVKCLIKAKSNRMACRFLNCILKYFPLCYKDIRYKAFKLMHRALETIGSNKKDLFYQLSKNNCRRLRHRSFITLPQKLSSQPRFRVLQLKYAKKVCQEFRQFQ